MNNQATQLPTPHPADRGAPHLSEGVQRRYKAAKIAPPILCAVCSLVGAISYSSFNFLGLLLFSPCAVAALVFCFAPVAKWRVSRKRHISYPIAIFCTIEFLFLIVLCGIAWRGYSAIILLVFDILFAGSEAACFGVQAHLGKKYPQILKEESIELKKLEEKYYFGGDNHVEM